MVEQIDDIPCDLCAEAIPFDLYSYHLVRGANSDLIEKCVIVDTFTRFRRTAKRNENVDIKNTTSC